MQIQEAQAKTLLSQYSIASPFGILAGTAEDAEAAAAQLDSASIFVKAQIEAGDRSRAGGIRRVRSASEAKAAAEALLGSKLATSQTARGGQIVHKVLVESGVEAAREFYLAMSIDTCAAAITVAMGEGGGTGIEQQLAARSVQLDTLRLGVDGERRSGDIAAFSRRLALPDAAAGQLRGVIARLHRAFVALDAGLIEINPLVLTAAGDWIAIDVKLVLDDNALYRHPELAALRGDLDADRTELRAQHHQINFVQMDGDVGTLVNGAGLGMATLDMIHAAGGVPANFMDIRTTAKSLDIAHGVGLVLDNPRAKVLLVNVFGGGMQPCDTIVEGLGIAYRRSRRTLPIVLRMTGNNEVLARLRLVSFGLPYTECTDMWQAVTGAVSLTQGRV
jgi:succinyl-CoA synthetase beta subunit